MSHSPHISEAESHVMQLLWDRHPLGADDICAVLVQQHSWQEATVKTLLNRLLNKGAIQAEKDGRRYLYSPRITKADWIDQESVSLIDRVFGGKFAPLVSHFCSHGKLSKDDLKAIRQIIDGMSENE